MRLCTSETSHLPHPLILRYHLRPEQQKRRGDFHAEQRDDRRGQLTMDNADLRRMGETPHQQVTDGLPKRGGLDAADKRVARARGADWTCRAQSESSNL